MTEAPQARSARTRALAVWGALGLVAVVALSLGSTGFHWPWPADDPIVLLRAPRVALGAIVGASLALSGVALQSVLHNPLAEPYVLGLAGGASAAATASLWLAPWFPPGLAAAAGAAAALAAVRAVAGGAAGSGRLVLSGVAVGSLLGSLTGMVLALAPGQLLLRGGMQWLFGGLGSPRWSDLPIPLAVVAVVGWGLRQHSEKLDRLGLGAEVAQCLGVPARRARRAVLLAAVALTASAVACAGLLGFVGLVAPHAGRLLVGASCRPLLPVAAGLGALLVVAADLAARTAFSPRELPVGLLTAALGGPWFLLQLRRAAADGGSVG